MKEFEGYGENERSEDSHSTSTDQPNAAQPIDEQPEGQEDRIEQQKSGILEAWHNLPFEAQVDVVMEELQILLTGEREMEIRQRLVTEGIQEKKEEDELIPISQLARITGYSGARLRALINDGKIDGEIRRTPTGQPGWFSSVEEVERYRSLLPDPEEFGKRGAQKRWSAKK